MSDPTAGQLGSETVLLHHAAPSRSSGVAVLLEELGAPYELRVWDLQSGAHLSEEFRAINAMAKVPTIQHRGQVVTELAACFIYLADAFPKAGLAPALEDPLRGPYLRWMVFYNASMEPAIIDKAAERDPGPRARSPYGSYDDVVAALKGQLQTGPYMLGERFLALDVLWGVSVAWLLKFGMLPDEPVFRDYAERAGQRPAMRKIEAMDQEIVAKRQG